MLAVRARPLPQAPSPSPISAGQQQNADDHQHMDGNKDQARPANRSSHCVITSDSLIFPIAGIAYLVETRVPAGASGAGRIASRNSSVTKRRG